MTATRGNSSKTLDVVDVINYWEEKKKLGTFTELLELASNESYEYQNVIAQSFVEAAARAREASIVWKLPKQLKF